MTLVPQGEVQCQLRATGFRRSMAWLLPDDPSGCYHKGILVRNLSRLDGEMQISVPKDDDGFTGRECPACEKLFKIELGTGLQGAGLPCHCPYCGHTAGQDQFLDQGPDRVRGVDSDADDYRRDPQGPAGTGVRPQAEWPVRYRSFF